MLDALESSSHIDPFQSPVVGFNTILKNIPIENVFR